MTQSDFEKEPTCRICGKLKSEIIAKTIPCYRGNHDFCEKLSDNLEMCALDLPPIKRTKSGTLDKRVYKEYEPKLEEESWERKFEKKWGLHKLLQQNIDQKLFIVNQVVKVFIAETLLQTIEEYRGEILKRLPKEKPLIGSDKERQSAQGFNFCLSQIIEIINNNIKNS